MRDRPSGPELAALADTLGASDALAARCAAIAAREQSAGEQGFEGIRSALIARYGAGDDRALLARLAAEIRVGALDRGSADRAMLAALLRAITQQKLRESNPAYLDEATPPP
jgi:hypothetical protein